MKSITTIILAGGESKRMGRDKAFLLWKGKTFLRHILERVSQFSDEIIISANKEESIYKKQLEGIKKPVKIIKDKNPYSGPLNGIVSCFKSISYDNVFIATCDTPDINLNTVRFLFDSIKGYDAVIPVINGKFQPLNTFYTKESISVAKHLYEKNVKSLFKWVENINANFVPDKDFIKYDLSLSMFRSINTPEEYRKFLLQKEL